MGKEWIVIIHIRIKVEHFQESGKKEKKNWLENFWLFKTFLFHFWLPLKKDKMFVCFPKIIHKKLEPPYLNPTQILINWTV